MHTPTTSIFAYNATLLFWGELGYVSFFFKTKNSSQGNSAYSIVHILYVCIRFYNMRTCYEVSPFLSTCYSVRSEGCGVRGEGCGVRGVKCDALSSSSGSALCCPRCECVSGRSLCEGVSVRWRRWRKIGAWALSSLQFWV